MKELWTMFWSFCRIGSLTFGGGYAMLPMLQKEVVEKYHWATEEQLLDYYAFSQCIPGIIAANTAAFIGYKTKGIPGAVVCTVGVVFPSLVVITVIAAFLSNFTEIQAVRHAFAGIRAAVCALILRAVIKLWKRSVKDWAGIVIFACAFVVTAFFKISPAVTVAAAATVGVLRGKLVART